MANLERRNEHIPAFTEQDLNPSMYLILSPTKDLQQFVLGHMEAFSDFSNMVKRPPAPMVQPTSTNGDIPWSPPKEWEKIKLRTKQ